MWKPGKRRQLEFEMDKSSAWPKWMLHLVVNQNLNAIRVFSFYLDDGYEWNRTVKMTSQTVITNLLTLLIFEIWQH